MEDGATLYCGTSICSWLRHCATRRKFAGSIPDGVVEISVRTMALRVTHAVTEVSTVNILWRTGGLRAAGAFG